MFKVGEIVKTDDGRMGFIEEIIIDPSPNAKVKMWREGKYSIYSTNPDRYKDKEKFYIGDYLGSSLQSTGTFVTVDWLNSMIGVFPDMKGIINDYQIVIKNHGREKGRNQIDKEIAEINKVIK